MTSTYSHTATCPNCCQIQTFQIPKGQTIDSYLREQTCFKCGCDMVAAASAPRWQRSDPLDEFLLDWPNDVRPMRAYIQ